MGTWQRSADADKFFSWIAPTDDYAFFEPFFSYGNTTQPSYFAATKSGLNAEKLFSTTVAVFKILIRLFLRRRADTIFSVCPESATSSTSSTFPFTVVSAEKRKFTLSFFIFLPA